MELEYLRVADYCFWTGGCQYHIDVRDGIIHYRIIRGEAFFEESLDDLSWVSAYEELGPDCGWSADTLREGIYKGDSALWLKIFEQIHVEQWKARYHAWVFDGGHFRCVCKFRGDDRRYYCDADGDSPDGLHYLYNLLSWLDADAPQPVYGSAMKFEASLYDCTGEKLLEQLTFERSRKEAVFMKDSGSGLVECERVTSEEGLSCLNDWENMFSEPIIHLEKFDKNAPDAIEVYRKINIPIPENTPILELCATFEIGTHCMRLRFHRGEFDKFWKRFAEKIDEILDKRGKMLLDDKLYYRGHTNDEAIYYSLSIPDEYHNIYACSDDDIEIGEEVMVRPILDSRRRAKANRHAHDKAGVSHEYMSEKEKSLWADDQISGIEALRCKICYKSYIVYRGGQDILPTIPKSVPLKDDEIIYCILSTNPAPWADDYLPEYYWTKREDVHIGTKVRVPVDGLSDVAIYEMRIYKLSNVPVPVDDVKCLDEYL